VARFKFVEILPTPGKSRATRVVHHCAMREWFWIGVVLAVAIGWDIHSFDGRVTSLAVTMASNAIHR
jgi:hypothetical protein